MNPLFAEANQTVQGAWIMGIMTAAFLFFFVAWALWAYDPGKKSYMEQAAQMPFEEGGES